MSEKILVPVLGESINEATVSKWLKKEGDAVEADEPIVELETDKVNLEVPSPVSGTLTEINSKDGSIVEVGALLGSVSENGSTMKKAEKIEKIKPTIEKDNVIKLETQNDEEETQIFEEKIEVEDVDSLSKIFLDHSVDGLILTNTSISGKEQLKNFQKSESGGLSGSPIYEKSNIIISEFYKRLRGKIPIIGAGGVSDGETAYEKIKSGASLLQLYTSLVFKGPYVASTINEELVELLKQDGFSNISQAVGINTNQ